MNRFAAVVKIENELNQLPAHRLELAFAIMKPDDW
jgi:hypothetical protein